MRGYDKQALREGRLRESIAREELEQVKAELATTIEARDIAIEQRDGARAWGKRCRDMAGSSSEAVCTLAEEIETLRSCLDVSKRQAISLPYRHGKTAATLAIANEMLSKLAGLEKELGRNKGTMHVARRMRAILGSGNGGAS